MDGNRRVNLIKETYSVGSYGQVLTSETSKSIYGLLNPITRTEWDTAGRAGYEADFRLDVYTFEYQGEKIVEVDGIRYGVYRSFIRINDDRTELYLHTVNGVTFDEDDIPEEEVQDYIDIYNALHSSGLPVFYGHAIPNQSLPYIVYQLDSDNFAADNEVYSRGYRLTASLYTARKSLKCERMLESALKNNSIFWERTETNDMDESQFVQTYEADIVGGE